MSKNPIYWMQNQKTVATQQNGDEDSPDGTIFVQFVHFLDVH
ncbi:hypothetical protein P879_10649 [Paragonimus westermani]|uniref:Uncharacterized protein n=1 Tax=Paragonimus westermani TaxID=34504 RepID=A0A8T0DHG7_9TREM|nr:hypothetical protein P879_10649 [Paragonimus westermani]